MLAFRNRNQAKENTQERRSSSVEDVGSSCHPSLAYLKEGPLSSRQAYAVGQVAEQETNW